MNHRYESSSSTAVLDSSADPVFRMLVLYHSDETGMDAAETAERVVQELGDGVAVERSFWNAGLLSSPLVRERAVEEAATADVIILAIPNDASAAGEIKAWTEAWQIERSKPGGLLAVLPEKDGPDATGLIEYLREAAISANMDFLSRESSLRA